MKDKTRLGIKLKIASATSVVLFTLLVSFVGIFAWFEATRTIDNKGDDFKVQKVGGSVTSFSIHEYYGVTEDGLTWGFNPVAEKTVNLNSSTPVSGSLRMGAFSLENPDHPVLILFAVSGEYELIKAKTSSEYLASEDATIQAENNPLSSVVESYNKTFNYDPKDVSKRTTGNLKHENGTTSSETYMAIPTSVKSTKESFVSFDNTGKATFSKEVTFYSGDVSNVSYVGVIVNYNTESLIYISSYHLGNSLLVDGLDFKCDWNLEV